MRTNIAKSIPETGSGSDKRIRRPLTRDDMDHMRIPARYWGVSFDRIRPLDAPHRKRIGAYMSKANEMVKQGWGLYLWGNMNVGKTAAAIVILMELRRWGYSGLFLSASQLKEAALSREQFDDASSLYRRSMNVDVLVIDGLGTEYRSKSSQYMEAVIDEVVRTRIQNQRVVILTSEIDPRLLKDVYVDESGRPWAQVMLGSVVDIWIGGHDYRAEENRVLQATLLNE